MNPLSNSMSRLAEQLDSYKKGGAFSSLALAALQPYARQSRKTFTDEDMQELAANIKKVGILSPILARQITEGKFEIVAGERRWRAAGIAGLKQVPVLIRELTDEEADEIHLYENIHRENLSSLDLAQRIAEDLKLCDSNLEQVAQKYGKSKSWVSKLSTIATGGEVLNSLVVSGASSDRAVLSTVAAIERKSPQAAKELVTMLQTPGSASNKRAITETFAKKIKQDVQANAAGKVRKSTVKGESDDTEPAWRSVGTIQRPAEAMAVFLELSPVSSLIKEFNKLSDKHGAARLCIEQRCKKDAFVSVEFGDSGLHRRVYEAQELRLLRVS